MDIRIISVFNGKSLLYLKLFCLEKINGVNQNFDN